MSSAPALPSFSSINGDQARNLRTLLQESFPSGWPYTGEMSKKWTVLGGESKGREIAYGDLLNGESPQWSIETEVPDVGKAIIDLIRKSSLIAGDIARRVQDAKAVRIKDLETGVGFSEDTRQSWVQERFQSLRDGQGDEFDDTYCVGMDVTEREELRRAAAAAWVDDEIAKAQKVYASIQEMAKGSDAAPPIAGRVGIRGGQGQIVPAQPEELITRKTWHWLEYPLYDYAELGYSPVMGKANYEKCELWARAQRFRRQHKLEIKLRFRMLWAGFLKKLEQIAEEHAEDGCTTDN